jgi:hypothetical protein
MTSSLEIDAPCSRSSTPGFAIVPLPPAEEESGTALEVVCCDSHAAAADCAFGERQPASLPFGGTFRGLAETHQSHPALLAFYDIERFELLGVHADGEMVFATIRLGIAGSTASFFIAEQFRVRGATLVEIRVHICNRAGGTAAHERSGRQACFRIERTGGAAEPGRPVQLTSPTPARRPIAVRTASADALGQPAHALGQAPPGPRLPPKIVLCRAA